MCVCLGEFIQTHQARPWKRMWGIQQVGGRMWVDSRPLGVWEGGLVGNLEVVVLAMGYSH